MEFLLKVRDVGKRRTGRNTYSLKNSILNWILELFSFLQKHGYQKIVRPHMGSSAISMELFGLRKKYPKSG